METLLAPEPDTISQTRVSFKGRGSDLFVIYLVNWLLTGVTLGLYYPWAKAAILRYMYGETELEGTKFVFHGTGGEMFWGFVKAILIFAALYATFIYFVILQNPLFTFLGFMIFYVGLGILIPMAIHGALRYRMSRTSWRGIHFGYRGNQGTLVEKYLIGMFLVIITLGIYSSWFTIDIRKYLIRNMRFGNITFSYNGKGGEFFFINFVGFLLSIVTFGIYFFWFAKNLFDYYINNLEAYQNGQQLKFRSSASAGKYFSLLVGNLLLVVFTLGLGMAWARVRTMNFIFNNIIIEGAFDADTIAQTEEDYRDATGEDMVDAMDIGIV